MLAGTRVAGAGAGASVGASAGAGAGTGKGSDDEFLQACDPSTILVRSGRCAASPPVGLTLQRSPYGKRPWFHDARAPGALRDAGDCSPGDR